MENLPKIIQEEKNLLISLKKDHEILQLKKENQLKTAQLEDLRNSLKTGEACPLCGSKEHPYSEHLPEFEDKLEVKVSAKNNEIDSLSIFNDFSELLKLTYENLEVTAYPETEAVFKKLKEKVFILLNHMEYLKIIFRKFLLFGNLVGLMSLKKQILKL